MSESSKYDDWSLFTGVLSSNRGTIKVPIQEAYITGRWQCMYGLQYNHCLGTG